MLLVLYHPSYSPYWSLLSDTDKSTATFHLVLLFCPCRTTLILFYYFTAPSNLLVSTICFSNSSLRSFAPVLGSLRGSALLPGSLTPGVSLSYPHSLHLPCPLLAHIESSHFPRYRSLSTWSNDMTLWMLQGKDVQARHWNWNYYVWPLATTWLCTDSFLTSGQLLPLGLRWCTHMIGAALASVSFFSSSELLSLRMCLQSLILTQISAFTPRLSMTI